MNRRHLHPLPLSALVAVAAPGRRAAPFEPTRFSVEVAGAGPDVILIPGLTAGATSGARPPRRCRAIAIISSRSRASPASRRAAMRAGAIVAPLADEIARYIDDRRLAPAGDRRPFDGRHAGDDDRGAPARAGRQDHGRRHAAAAGRPVRPERGGHRPARRQPRQFRRDAGRPPPVRRADERVQPARQPPIATAIRTWSAARCTSWRRST